VVTTESKASLVVRILVRLSKLSSGPWEGLVDLAYWIEENIPLQVLEDLMDKLESMEIGKGDTMSKT
jgi:hypothetical protein